MTALKLLGEGKFHEITVYNGEGRLEQEAVKFEGSLRLHYNPNMVWLLTHPLEQDSAIYEFRVEDIVHAKERPSITRPDGLTVEMVRLYVRKGAMATKMVPLVIGADMTQDERR